MRISISNDQQGLSRGLVVLLMALVSIVPVSLAIGDDDAHGPVRQSQVECSSRRKVRSENGRIQMVLPKLQYMDQFGCQRSRVANRYPLPPFTLDLPAALNSLGSC